MHSGSIASEANRWTGTNNQGYVNPRVTIEPEERIALERALLQEALGDLAVLPLYWQTDALLLLKNVRGLASWRTVD